MIGSIILGALHAWRDHKHNQQQHTKESIIMSTTYTTGARVRAGDLNIGDLYRVGIASPNPVRRVTHKAKTMIIGEKISDSSDERTTLQDGYVYRVAESTPPADPCETPTPAPTWRVGQRVEYNGDPATIISIGQQRLFVRHDSGAEWSPTLDSSLLKPIKPVVPYSPEYWGARAQWSDNGKRYASKVFDTKQAAMNWCAPYHSASFVCTISHSDGRGKVTYYDRHGDEATIMPFDEWKAAQASSSATTD